MEEIINVRNETQFNRLVAHQTVLIQFWAKWCVPCRSQLAIIESVQEDHLLSAGVLVAKVNVDENPKLVTRFNIDTIPTILVFRNGKMTKRFTGIQGAETLLAAVNEPALAK
ncbi:MAG: thioredoxin family protein [Lentisphaeria bacterium]|nr:thioredoxin family protein [Lentisphaeria bacterium]